MSPQSRSKSADNRTGSTADIKRSVDRLSQPKPKRTAPPVAVPSPTKPNAPRIPPTRPSPREPTQKPALTPVKSSTPSKVSIVSFL